MTLVLASSSGHAAQISKDNAHFDIFSSSARLNLSRSFAATERVSGLVAGVPMSMVEQWADGALLESDFEQLPDGSWFAAVSGAQGAWGEGSQAEEALKDLRDALIGWAVLRLINGQSVPEIRGSSLSPVEHGQAS